MSIIGIDCGATKIEFMLIDDNLSKSIDKFRISTPKSIDYKLFLSIIEKNINKLLNNQNSNVTKIGVGIPGTINPIDKYIRISSIKYIINKSLEKDLNKLLKIPVIVENDSKCFALSEALLGAGKGYSSVVGVILGTGLAAGYVIDGKLIRGNYGMSGEIGHWIVNPLGVKCQCGRNGCFETLVSGSALERIYWEISSKKLPALEIYNLYQKVQKDAVTTFTIYLNYYGKFLASLINIIDPQVIILGGGVSNISVLYDLGITYINKYLFGGNLNTKVIPNKLGDSSGIYGACLLK